MKITDEDWRNRDKYPQYKAAVEDIFRLTSTPFAPWIILESDDKRYARVKALKNYQRRPGSALARKLRSRYYGQQYSKRPCAFARLNEKKG